MKTELDFLSEIGGEISDALWSERELSKKEKILQTVQDKIGERISGLLPPGTRLMA